MKLNPALILKTIIVLITIGLSVLAIGVSINEMTRDVAPGFESHRIPTLLYFYALITPLYVGLHQAYKILMYIDQKKIFSVLTIKALRRIKISALTFIFMIALGISLAVAFYDDDHAGIASLGMMISFATFIIATVAALLEKLIQDAINLKSENELTI